MYNPPVFREDRPEVLHDFIKQHPLAAIVTQTADGGLEANHIPVMLVEEGSILRGHISKANPMWQRPVEREALAIFTGPSDYISPSWYPSKREHGRVVPTWNYSVVHAYGTLEFYQDKERLRAVVDQLTRIHEASFPEQWNITDAPLEFIEGLLNAIVGVDLKISRLEGKFKQSQNRSEDDRTAVFAALRPDVVR